MLISYFLSLLLYFISHCFVSAVLCVLSYDRICHLINRDQSRTNFQGHLHMQPRIPDNRLRNVFNSIFIYCVMSIFMLVFMMKMMIIVIFVTTSSITMTTVTVQAPRSEYAKQQGCGQTKNPIARKKVGTAITTRMMILCHAECWWLFWANMAGSYYCVWLLLFYFLPSTTIDCQCSSVPSTGKQTIFIFTQLSAIVWSLFHISEPWGVCTFNNFFRTHHYHPFRRVLISEGVDFPFSREKSPESRLFLISQPCPWIRHNPTLIPSQTLFFFFSTHIWAPTHPSPLKQPLFAPYVIMLTYHHNLIL